MGEGERATEKTDTNKKPRASGGDAMMLSTSGRVGRPHPNPKREKRQV